MLLNNHTIQFLFDSPLVDFETHAHSNISGNSVVWQGNGGKIYFYDGNKTVQFSSNDSYGNVVWSLDSTLTGNDVAGSFEPDISGKNIVWRGGRGNIIYLYRDGRVTQITDKAYNS
jgi:hypothetical protein